jgi:hypothetical protein
MFVTQLPCFLSSEREYRQVRSSHLWRLILCLLCPLPISLLNRLSAARKQCASLATPFFVSQRLMFLFQLPVPRRQSTHLMLLDRDLNLRRILTRKQDMAFSLFPFCPRLLDPICAPISL